MNIKCDETTMSGIPILKNMEIKVLKDLTLKFCFMSWDKVVPAPFLTVKNM